MGHTELRWFREVALWLAVLVAVSPTLVDLIDHWSLHSWSRYSLGFLPLLILAIRNDRPATNPQRIPILLLIAACLLGQILAVLAAAVSIARPLVGVLVMGMLLYRGTRMRTAVLALCLIPVPNATLHWLGSPELTQALVKVAATMLNGLGASVHATGRALEWGDLRLAIGPQWGGILLAFQGLGLAWYCGVRRDLGRLATAAALALAVLVAIPVQFALLIASSLALWAGQPSLASLFLDPGSWVLPLFAAFLLGKMRGRASDQTSG
ncbi:MAG: hypothetical protein GY723_10905 [bacterium]|nr:hypothetical protein [bacterium]MCP5068201.1 hypothetical protein [bacterium]